MDGNSFARGAGAPRRAAASLAAVVAVVAVSCVQPPGPGPSPTSTTTTAAPTTTTTAPTTTTTPTTTTSTTTTTTTTSTTTTTTTTTAPTTTTSTTTTTTVAPSLYTPIAMSCRTPNPIGSASIDAFDNGVTTNAPSSVAAGSNFQVEMTADPIEVPTSGGGQTILHLTNVKIRFDIPANSSFVSATVAGGSNLGAGTPTVAQVGNQIVLTVPGQLAAGTTANLPTVTATLQATGAPGSTIETQMSGTGYSDPGITWTTTIQLFGITANSSCYAPVNPVLSTTDIT